MRGYFMMFGYDYWVSVGISLLVTVLFTILMIVIRTI